MNYKELHDQLALILKADPKLGQQPAMASINDDYRVDIKAILIADSNIEMSDEDDEDEPAIIPKGTLYFSNEE